MSDSVQKNILISVKSESDLSALEKAMAKLSELDALVKSVSTKATIKLDTDDINKLAGAAGSVKKLSEAQGEAAQTAATFSKRLTEQANALGITLEKQKEIQRIAANGKSTSISVLGGPGLTGSFTKETGAFSIATDFTKTPAAEQARLQQKRIEETDLAQRKADADAAARQQKLQEYIASLQKKRIEEIDLAQRKSDADAYNRQLKLAEENQLRANNLASFNQLSSRPGVTRRLGPERIGSNGNLVQDEQLLNENGKVFATLNSETGKATASLKEFKEEGAAAGDSLLHAAGKVATWTLATGLVFGVLRALKDSVTVFAEVELATARLQRVGQGLGTTHASIQANAQQLTRDIQALSIAYGGNSEEALKAAQVFAKLGFSADQVKNSVRAALQLSALTGADTAESAQKLSSIFSEFELRANQLPAVISKLSIVERESNVSMDALLAGIARAGGIVHESGTSFEYLAAAIGKVSASTGKTPNIVANAIASVSGKFGQDDIGARLNKITSDGNGQGGIVFKNQSGDIKEFSEVISELAARWNSFNEGQKNAILNIAGERGQRQVLLALIKEQADIQALANKEQSGAATESQRVNKELAIILDTLSEKMVSLKEAAKAFGVAVVDSGAGAGINLLIEGFTGALQLATDIKKTLDSLGAISYTIPILGQLIAAGDALKAVREFLKDDANSPNREGKYDVRDLTEEEKKSRAKYFEGSNTEAAKKFRRDNNIKDPIDAKPSFDKQALSDADLDLRIQEIQRKARIEFTIGEKLAVSPLEKARTKIQELQAEIKGLENLKIDVKADQEKVIKINNEIKKLKDNIQEVQKVAEADIFKEKLDKSVKLFESSFNRQIKLRDKIADFTAEPGLAISRPNREIQKEIDAEKRTIDELQRTYDGLNAKRNAFSGSPQDRGVLDQQTQLASNELEQAKARLEDKLVEQKIRQLDLEKRLNDERRQASEHLSKELATMTDVDLIRTRILAGNLEKGGKIPTGADFLNLDQGSRSFLSKLGLAPNVQLRSISDAAVNIKNQNELREQQFDSPRFNDALRAAETKLPFATAGAVAGIGSIGSDLKIQSLTSTIANATFNIENFGGHGGKGKTGLLDIGGPVEDDEKFHRFSGAVSAPNIASPHVFVDGEISVYDKALHDLIKADDTVRDLLLQQIRDNTKRSGSPSNFSAPIRN